MPNNHRLNRLRTSFDCCPIHVSLLAWLVLLFLLSEFDSCECPRNKQLRTRYCIVKTGMIHLKR